MRSAQFLVRYTVCIFDDLVRFLAAPPLQPGCRTVRPRLGSVTMSGLRDLSKRPLPCAAFTLHGIRGLILSCNFSCSPLGNYDSARRAPPLAEASFLFALRLVG